MTTAPGQVRRYLSLDHIRGLSIFGILFVNATAFAHPFWVYAGAEPSGIPLSEADRLAQWAINSFAHSKFITLFSLLFGVSVCLIGDRIPPEVKGLRSPLVRRLLWLLVIGLLHGVVIWMGDILLLYALSGLIFLRMRHWQARRLLLWGAAGYGLMSLLMMAMIASQPAGATEVSEGVRYLSDLMRSGLSGSLSGNIQQWAANAPFGNLFYILVTLPLMMLGAGLFRVGFLKGTLSGRIYGWVITAGAVHLLLISVIFWMAIVRSDPGLALWARLAEGAPPIFISLAYASGLILIGKSGFGQRLLYPLSCAGKMAFTNYIGQSLIMTALFYGGRFPLPESWWPRQALEAHMGHAFPWYSSFNEATLVTICAVIVVCQMAFSTAWMQAFRYGPFEWVWRSLTQWRIVPITR